MRVEEELGEGERPELQDGGGRTTTWYDRQGGSRGRSDEQEKYVRIVLSTAFGGLPHWGFSKSCAIWLVSLGKKQAFIQLEKQTRLRRMMTQELTAGMTRSPCHHPSDDPYPPCTVLRSTNRQTAGFCSGSSASRQFGSTARATAHRGISRVIGTLSPIDPPESTVGRGVSSPTESFLIRGAADTVTAQPADDPATDLPTNAVLSARNIALHAPAAVLPANGVSADLGVVRAGIRAGARRDAPSIPGAGVSGVRQVNFLARTFDRVACSEPPFDVNPVFAQLTDIMLTGSDDTYPTEYVLFGACCRLPAVKRLYGHRLGADEDHAQPSALTGATAIETLELQLLFARAIHATSLCRLAIDHEDGDPFYFPAEADSGDRAELLSFVGFTSLTHLRVAPIFLFGRTALMDYLGLRTRTKY
ncbi:hypothetical protein VC83_04029 [Pseudogymnoascus destructans]|uniref:Uncharacterized protein n=1 Tax=Pseudogymnoascus destructans TaxID=655981 RepID=A0A177AF47_9PEZI|nr:uncharacterized protein VC83_04029 [Pseudogymnoascus destructans]OAF59803.1 hypothetical protein VC83_04029 [Pseudogymnoascus destructans]